MKQSKRMKVYQKTDGRCAYCGEPIDPNEDWQPDHYIPLCQGGTDNLNNLWPAHRSCNASKNGRTPEQWADTIKRRLLNEFDEFKRRIEAYTIIDECAQDLFGLLNHTERQIRGFSPTFYLDKLNGGEDD